MSMTNRVAIVTGGTSGIGLATLQKLLADGFRVAFCGRSEVQLARTLKQVRAYSDCTIGLTLDLKDPDAASELVNTTVATWGKVDVLVNNAGGIVTAGTFDDLHDQDWRDAIDINLMSAVRMIRATLPNMTDHGGRIVNVSSFVALQPGSWNPHYSAAKAALINLTKHVARNYAHLGILANSVSPGHIRTNGWSSLVKTQAASRGASPVDALALDEARVSDLIPLQRMGTATEVADCIAFLVSPQASYVTGANLIIDGGRISAL